MTAPVLHLTRDLPPATTSGISTASDGLARSQAAAGRRVAVISFDAWRPRARPGAATAPPQPRAEGPLTVLRVRSQGDLDAATAFAVTHAPALIHVHDALLWPLAATLRASLGVPAVLHVHVLHAAMNALRGLATGTLSLAAQEEALAAADAIIVPAEALLPHLLAAAPQLAPRLFVVGLGHDAPTSPTSPPPPPPGPPSAARPFVYVGRFDDVKGLPELFAALPRLLALFPAAHAVVAGGLPGSPRGEARWRERYRRDAGPACAARTHFPGWLGPDALDALYRAAAVVLVPSRFETFGQVALEALARGAPVVATDAGGLAELVTDGVNGRVVPVGDVDALVAAAADLYRDPDAAAGLGRAAAAAAEARRWPQALAALDRAYEAALMLHRSKR